MAAPRNDGGVTATAEVVKGGNERFEIRVPVAIGDRAGNVWWQDVAVAHIDMPRGARTPDVRVVADMLPIVRKVARDG